MGHTNVFFERKLHLEIDFTRLQYIFEVIDGFWGKSYRELHFIVLYIGYLCNTFPELNLRIAFTGDENYSMGEDGFWEKSIIDFQCMISYSKAPCKSVLKIYL